MARDAGETSVPDWAGALAALGEQLDAVDRRLEGDGWGPEDLPAPVVLPPPGMGNGWTADDRRFAEDLLVRLQAVTARTEAALAAVADELGDLPRRRDAAQAYGGRWQTFGTQRSRGPGDAPRVIL